MSDNENQLKSNTEVDDTASVSQFTIIENSSPDNVRNRISSWLTEVVGEVRKKGVAVSVPKWVEASSFGNTTSQNSNLLDHKKTEKCDILIAQKVSDIELNENLNESNEAINYNNLKIRNQNTNEKEPEINISSKFWSRFSFDRSHTNQNHIISTNQNEKGKVFQIKTFGKTKISEIYEKVRIKKEKLPNLKKIPATMDENTFITKVISFNDEAVKIAEPNQQEDEKNNDSRNKDNMGSKNKKDTKCNYEILDIIKDILEDHECSVENEISNETFSNNSKGNEQKLGEKQKHKENQIVPEKRSDKNFSFKKFERNLRLGQMGRSSTLSSKYLYDDDNDNSKYQFPANSLSIENQPLTDSGFMSSTPNNKSKRHLSFGSIYRSFSEQQPDVIDETEELINERSHSFNVIEGENSEIKKLQSENETQRNSIENSNKKKDGTKNNISTSLPTFSTINLIQHLKSPRKQNSENFASCGDSSSSICMDISPCGSGSVGTSASDTRDLNLRRKNTFIRDNSYQSDSSHCSSVDSLLESRKPDPETILISLGFGPIDSEDILAKIPKRFLKPSQVRGIDTEAFLRRQQLMNSIHDHSVLGYRGLLGNPDLPPSVIVAKIMERFEQNEINRWNIFEYNRPQSAPPNSMGLQKFQYNA